MKKLIKQWLESLVKSLVLLMNGNSVGRLIIDRFVSEAMNRKRVVRHNGVELSFVVSNNFNNFRFETFSTKEPETLEWIDGIPEGSVIWDIGANVGLYTCYAAKARGCRVFAFEPSVFNLELLARNIFLNKLTDKVTIVPLALSDTFAFSTLNMTSTVWGGALSTFAKDYGQSGKALNKVFEFQTIGISMMDAMESLRIPQPDYIKIDVDGIEHLILKGGEEILRKVKEVLIEIDDGFKEQAVESSKYLKNANLVFKEKRQAEMFKNTIYENSFNQIWHRPC